MSGLNEALRQWLRDCPSLPDRIGLELLEEEPVCAALLTDGGEEHGFLTGCSGQRRYLLALLLPFGSDLAGNRSNLERLEAAADWLREQNRLCRLPSAEGCVVSSVRAESPAVQTRIIEDGRAEYRLPLLLDYYTE